MQGAKGERDYLSYLLRIWRAGSGERARWRASLQDPYTGQRIIFACLNDALAFLNQKMMEGDASLGDRSEGCAQENSI